jgi:hypothetical protein
MKPFKALSPFSGWLLRLGVLLVALANIWPSFKSISLTTISSIIAIAYLVFAVLLFWGGFLKKHTVTMLSGLFLFLLSGWIAYHSSIGNLFSLILASYLLVGFVGFHFFINGNN